MDINKLSIYLDNKHFPDSLCVEWLDGKQWRLFAPFSYHRDNGEIIVVHKDFITDFGSKPWWCWSFVGSPTDEAGPAYIIHDYLCSLWNYPKNKADWVFYEVMEVLKVPAWKRWIMYVAVRIWHGFQSKAKNDVY